MMRNRNEVRTRHLSLKYFSPPSTVERSPSRTSGRTGGFVPLRDWERVLGQIERGEVRAGPDAAREIARRIEAQGGFWGPKVTEGEAFKSPEGGPTMRAA